MKHVLQTVRETEVGNCLNACLASILEIPLESVADFHLIPDNGEWWIAVQEWAKSVGFQLLYIPLTPHVTFFQMPEEPLCIGVGRTLKGNPHAVVGQMRGGLDNMDFMQLHDPMDNNGIENVDAVIYLIPLQPEKLVRHEKKNGQHR